MDPGQGLALLLIASPVATISALRHRSWQLIPSLQLAAAVALRWHVGGGGWLKLLGIALIAGLAGGPGTILLDSNLFWLLLVWLVVGFAALAWERPPWSPVSPRGHETRF